MQALLDVVLPVFLVLGAGYFVVWRGWFDDAGVAGLMRFTQSFAFPCLLFRAIATLKLGEDFHLPLLAAFYLGAFSGFAAALLMARFLFSRPWTDAVAIGFVGMFSNSLMLGLPITERAYGTEALGPNFAIIAIHAPLLYIIGITAMEIARAQGSGTPIGLIMQILRSTFRNALVIGIGLGFVVNFSDIPLPGVLMDAIDLITRAALPAALFGLGGVLVRYRPEGDLRTILCVCAISLGLHPAVTFGLGHLFGLTTGQLRSAVITASVAPGVNAYVFANMYGVAKRVAASSVLFATGLALVTVWFWLSILP